ETLREQWFDRMQERSTNLFVQVSNTPVSLSLTFLAPNKTVASNLTQEAGEYLHASTFMHLIAPWSPEAHNLNYPEFRRARAAWQKMGAELTTIYKDPDYKAYTSKLTAAMKRGAMADVKKLSDEQQKKIKELRAQALEKMASNADNQTAELARLYGKLQDVPYTNRVERQKL